MDSRIIPSRVVIPFNYAAGKTASRFFVELRDHKRIMAVRCPGCKKVIVPPQLFCVECFTETTDWIEVGPSGILRNFTVVSTAEPHYPLPVPFGIGIIRLDAADTDLIHLVGGTAMDTLAAGMRVVPEFREDRTGSINDIHYFKPQEAPR
jgi:uncharacterized OB-fold protein